MTDPAPAIVRLVDFARLRGVTKAAVTKWRGRGLLVMTADGKVNVEASNQLLDARHYQGGGKRSAVSMAAPRPEKPAREPAAAKPVPTGPENWTTAEAVRRERIAMAKLREIEADIAAGLAAPIAEFKRVVAGEYALVRTPLLGLASKLAYRLAAATTPEACGTIVDTEVRAILEALTADGAS